MELDTTPRSPGAAKGKIRAVDLVPGDVILVVPSGYRRGSTTPDLRPAARKTGALEAVVVKVAPALHGRQTGRLIETDQGMLVVASVQTFWHKGRGTGVPTVERGSIETQVPDLTDVPLANLPGLVIAEDEMAKYTEPEQDGWHGRMDPAHAAGEGPARVAAIVAASADGPARWGDFTSGDRVTWRDAAGSAYFGVVENLGDPGAIISAGHVPVLSDSPGNWPGHHFAILPADLRKVIMVEDEVAKYMAAMEGPGQPGKATPPADQRPLRDGDVVTILEGTQQYDVLRISDVEAEPYARLAPRSPEDMRDPFWVRAATLHLVPEVRVRHMHRYAGNPTGRACRRMARPLGWVTSDPERVTCVECQTVTAESA